MLHYMEYLRMLLLPSDKQILNELIHTMQTYNGHKRENLAKYKEDLELLLYKYRKTISKSFLKFVKIYILTGKGSYVRKHYTGSLHFQEVLKELSEMRDLHCAYCGKLIPVLDKKGYNIATTRITCNRQCQNRYQINEMWATLKKDKKRLAKRTQRIQATMVKRYGGRTTMESPTLKKQAMTTRRKNKEISL